MIKIAPSILSADFADLKNALWQCEEGGADYIHLDIMDGHFVPNITIGPPVVNDLKKHTNIPLDVHLMIENPDYYVSDFIEAGASILTVHVEACQHLKKTLQFIKDHGVRAGISLNPETSLATIEQVIDNVDVVLIMSVNPGFGGQKFIPDSIRKIKQLYSLLKDRGILESVEIEVDGGIKLNNAHEIIAAGANVLVAGSAIFLAKNPIDMIKKFKQVDDYLSN